MTSNAKTTGRFVFQKDGVDYLKLCVDVTLFFIGPPSTHAEGILDFYTQTLSVIKPDIVQYETGTMSKPRRVKADTFEMLPLWVTDPKAKKDIMRLRLDNSTGPDSAADRGFQFVYFEHFKAGQVRLLLPASFVEKSAGPFSDLARRVAQKLKFSSGLGGYSLNWNRVGELAHEAKKDIYVISQRHPGIDIPDSLGDTRAISQGIKCVNWLTFLDEGYVERLGGAGRLRKELSDEVVLTTLTNGIVIQAGPQPETGDVNLRQTLPLYHNVGKAVAKLRAKDHSAFIPDPKNPERATEKWLARFDS